MDICLHQVNFSRAPIHEFVWIAREAGFGALELHPLDGPSPLDEVARVARDSGLRVITANPLPGWFQPRQTGLTSTAADLIRAAAAVGAAWVVAPAPVYLPEAEPRPEPAALIDALGRLFDGAEAAGVGLAFEPVGLSIKRPGAIGAVGSIEESLLLIDAVSPRVKLVLDTFCLATAGEDLGAPQLPPADRVAAIQLADWDGQTLQRRLPGAGTLDLGGFMSAARAAGYGCPVSLEVFPMDADDPPGFARYSARYLGGVARPTDLGRT